MYSIPFISLKMVAESHGEYKLDSVECPDDAAYFISTFLDGEDRENMVVLLLNTTGRVVGMHRVSVGTLNASAVSAREVFKSAIMSNAASIIVGHNHPSDNVTPSREDDHVAAELRAAGKILGIPMLDFIIVGAGKSVTGEERYYSYKEKQRAGLDGGCRV